MRRNSFMKLTKLTDVKGRINYISSSERQENLYAVHETVPREFWKQLARTNQAEFRRSGTEGKCIEARELIIALPENFIEYNKEQLLYMVTEHFKEQYGVECIAALHHNKKKTNYHVHLIFSERKLLEQPVEKIATRNMYYDERGRHVRTKKEVVGTDNQLRPGCTMIPKGEVYERNLFGPKLVWFKDERFLDEAKRYYTEFINLYTNEEHEKLQVFNRNSVYLPMKKEGKNSREFIEKIQAENEIRRRWNRNVDYALACRVPDVRIMEVKREYIAKKVSSSIRVHGAVPQLFADIILQAIDLLLLLIEKALGMDTTTQNKIKTKRVKVRRIYEEIHTHLELIDGKQVEVLGLERELEGTKGLFQGKQRKELQRKIQTVSEETEQLKDGLHTIVQEHGYQSMEEFMNDYNRTNQESNELERKTKPLPAKTVEVNEAILRKVKANNERVIERGKEAKRSKKQRGNREER